MDSNFFIPIKQRYLQKELKYSAIFELLWNSKYSLILKQNRHFCLLYFFNARLEGQL
jgi:hypothetical protein